MDPNIRTIEICDDITYDANGGAHPVNVLDQIDVDEFPCLVVLGWALLSVLYSGQERTLSLLIEQRSPKPDADELPLFIPFMLPNHPSDTLIALPVQLPRCWLFERSVYCIRIFDGDHLLAQRDLVIDERRVQL